MKKIMPIFLLLVMSFAESAVVNVSAEEYYYFYNGTSYWIAKYVDRALTYVPNGQWAAAVPRADFDRVSMGAVTKVDSADRYTVVDNLAHGFSVANISGIRGLYGRDITYGYDILLSDPREFQAGNTYIFKVMEVVVVNNDTEAQRYQNLLKEPVKVVEQGAEDQTFSCNLVDNLEGRFCVRELYGDGDDILENGEEIEILYAHPGKKIGYGSDVEEELNFGVIKKKIHINFVRRIVNKFTQIYP